LARGRRAKPRKIHIRTTIRVRAMKNPSSGEVNSGISTLLTTPSHLTAPVPLAAIVAPSRPPMRAWLEELGRPSHQVIRFQVMAPMRAAATTTWVVVCSSTRPAPMVLATAVPAKAPMKLKEAAMRSAYWGRRARVATDVAIALAVSWKPLM
jgi:hypothetical protein